MTGFFHNYRDHRFTKQTIQLLTDATRIVDSMREQGYKLTLRQLYYRLVSEGLIANDDKVYKKLGRIVVEARESGRMDWLAIEDRGRAAYGPTCIEDPAELISSVEDRLKFDQWMRQDNYIEVWVEKQALEAVVARPCNRLDTIYMACKGYLSASEAWRAGQRFQSASMAGKTCTLIHLADHDPSGMNMTDDNRSRVRLFAEENGIEVRRIALNMDQVEEYGPPPNPTKEKDSRSNDYIKKFGKSSWELDALEPRVLDELITNTINEYRDPVRWQETLDEQDAARKPLQALTEHWGAVHKFMKDQQWC